MSAFSVLDVVALSLSAFLLGLCFVLVLCQFGIACSKGCRDTCNAVTAVYFLGAIIISLHTAPPYLQRAFGLFDLDILPDTDFVNALFSEKAGFYSAISFYLTGFFLVYVALFIKLHRSILPFTEAFHVIRIKGRRLLLVFLVFGFMYSYYTFYYCMYRHTESTCPKQHLMALMHPSSLSVEVMMFLYGIYLTLYLPQKERRCLSIRWGLAMSVLVGITIQAIRIAGVTECSRDQTALLSSVRAFGYVLITIGPALGNQGCLPCSKIQIQTSNSTKDASYLRTRRMHQRRQLDRLGLAPLPRNPDTGVTSVYY